MMENINWGRNNASAVQGEECDGGEKKTGAGVLVKRKGIEQERDPFLEGAAVELVNRINVGFEAFALE